MARRAPAFDASNGLPGYLFRDERDGEQVAHADGGKSPFLSGEKLPFALRRMAETCLGGVRFPATDQSLREMGYVHGIQLALLCAPYPLALAVGAMLGHETAAAAAVYAGCVAACGLVLRGAGAWAQRRAGDGGAMVSGGGAANDEPEYDFSGCAAASTCAFVCEKQPGQHGWLIALVQLLAAAAVGFLACAVLSWRLLLQLLGGAQVACALVHIMGWLTACLSLYSLGVHEPAEPNIHSAP
jgi:hypothetical protein